MAKEYATERKAVPEAGLRAGAGAGDVRSVPFLGNDVPAYLEKLAAFEKGARKSRARAR